MLFAGKAFIGIQGKCTSPPHRASVARSLELLFIVESPSVRFLGQNGSTLIVELRGDGGRAIRHNQSGASGAGAGAGAVLAKQWN